MPSYKLGPLEQQVMNCIWEHEEETVREVYNCLKSKRNIAYTTVMTIMGRLVDKGFLSRKKHGKAHVYSPTKTKEQAARGVIGKVFNTLVDQFGEEAVVAFSDEVDKVSRKKK